MFYLHRKLGAVVGGQGFELAGTRGPGRVRALLCRPRHHPCQLRGLSRRGDDRPRARRGATWTRRIACPLLVLWGEQRADAPPFRRAGDLAGEGGRARSRAGRCRCGHFLPEEQPEATGAELTALLRRLVAPPRPARSAPAPRPGLSGAGCASPASSRWNSPARSSSSLQAVSVMMLTWRGRPSSSATSPKNEPGPSTRRRSAALDHHPAVVDEVHRIGCSPRRITV